MAKKQWKSAATPLLALAGASAMSLILSGCADQAMVDMTGFRKPDPAMVQLEQMKAASVEISLAQKELQEAAKKSPATMDETLARAVSQASASRQAGDEAVSLAKQYAKDQISTFETQVNHLVQEQRSILSGPDASALSASEKDTLAKSIDGIQVDLASARQEYENWDRNFDTVEAPKLRAEAEQKTLEGFDEDNASAAVFDAALLAGNSDWGPDSTAAASFAPDSTPAGNYGSGSHYHSSGNSMLWWWALSHSGRSTTYVYGAPTPANSMAQARSVREASQTHAAERQYYSSVAAARAGASPARSASATPSMAGFSSMTHGVAAAAAPSGFKASAPSYSARPIAPPPSLAAKLPSNPALAAHAAQYKPAGRIAPSSPGLANLQAKLSSMRAGSVATASRSIGASRAHVTSARSTVSAGRSSGSGGHGGGGHGGGGSSGG